MFKYMNPRRMYHAMGRRHFIQFCFLILFLFFFYGPLLNMCMLAFADTYQFPAIIPQKFGFRFWSFLFGQDSFISSVFQSLLLAVTTTAASMVLCIPAAYSIARYQFTGRKMFMFSFLLTNAFPKMGIYTSVGILFYKYNLMGTFLGVLLIHMIQTMMFMVWLPCNAFRSIHRQQEEAARDAGAGPVRTFFKITFPMAMPGIAVAALYTFLGSLEEAQGTLIVGLARWRTMPIEMYGLILDGSRPLAAAVFGILLIVPSILMIYLMRRFIGPQAVSGGFKMS